VAQACVLKLSPASITASFGEQTNVCNSVPGARRNGVKGGDPFVGVPQIRASDRRRGRGVRRIAVAPEVREHLERWIRAGTTPQRVVKRARIVLLAADGLSNRAIARALDISPRTAGIWRERYSACGLGGLLRDAPGRGRAARITTGEAAARIQRLVEAGGDRGGWTIRRLAAATGISRASVHRILRAREAQRGTHQ
jgi:transposase